MRQPFQGRLRPPGDKSVSHRAALLAGAARGRSRLRNLAPGADVASTLRALEALGVRLERRDGLVEVESPGLDGWREPEDVIDCGNSGTTIRLLAGLLAGRPGLAILTGDASLRRRPMDRVAEPLRAMGARVDGREGGRFAPLALRGGPLRPLAWRSPVASAQVKSSILLAGLRAQGETVVREPARSRDHTERLFLWLGLPLAVDETPASGTAGEAAAGAPPPVRLAGPASPPPFELEVPGDPSSAFPWAVRAVLTPGSELEIEGVLLNPLRLGGYRLLERMGARLELVEEARVGGEPVGRIRLRASALHALEVRGEDVPAAVDELPLLAVAACAAEGESRFQGLGELRVKESDRVRAMARGLAAMGLPVEEEGDGWRVRGPARARSARVSSAGDHRVAMALAVAAWTLLAPGEAVELEGAESVAISDPDFFRRVGAG
ncbi:MAG: 3-phosphoshikimate 1-carboxyvinyltransferase [Bacillota bacterium]|nr:3-phosphoshikimate 1-carboxyvinyltransferase [Bacillota bacterium]